MTAEQEKLHQQKTEAVKQWIQTINVQDLIDKMKSLGMREKSGGILIDGRLVHYDFKRSGDNSDFDFTVRIQNFKN